MLQKFQRVASKIFITLLFLVLILSFALWGIPNYTRDQSGRPLVTVGSAQITDDEYRRFLDLNVMALGNQMGQRLTRDNARIAYRFQQMQYGNFGADLDREVLNLQIGQAVLEGQAKKMGLTLSDQTIAEMVRNDPQYQGPDKKFSRQRFDDLVRQTGLNEAAYLRERKAGELREQLTETISSGVGAPKSLVTILHKFQEEQRIVSYFVMDPAKQPKVAEPDEAKLKEHYEQNKRQFFAPETRKIAVLLLTRDDIKAKSVVEDAEVKATWEKDQNVWNIPERRRVQQIAFKTKDAAIAVAKEIAGGKSFLMAALEEQGAAGRLDQGLLPRSAIPDGKVAAATFSLPLNTVSEPIETRGGALLIRVNEIQPGKTRTFDEVATEVREELEQKKQRENATRLHEQVEDLRGGNKTLKQIADELKLKLIEADGVNKSGQGPDGKPALAGLTELPKILASAFEGPKETPREPMELSDGSEVWIEVQAVTPEKQKPFEDVKADVKAIWLELETRKALSAAAQTLADKIKAGEKIDAIAKAQGAKVETSLPFKRQGGVPGLSATAVRQAFALPAGAAATGETPEGKSRMILVLNEIKSAPDPTKDEAERIERGLAGQYQNDVRTLYISALRNQTGVTIDEKLFERLVGDDKQTRR